MDAEVQATIANLVNPRTNQGSSLQIVVKRKHVKVMFL
jgi:hypothetical protein